MKLEANPAWLRASRKGEVGKIDRENGIIHGVILAEEGPFKSEGRGEFDREAIKQIAKMANAAPGGLKARWTHPSLSSDGLGKFLGRQRNALVAMLVRGGKEIAAVRADLHFDKTALDTPPEGGKPLGVYLMDLAESDPDAFGTSLVLKVRQEYRLDKQGRALKDDAGNELPPLWYPEQLHASDVVDTGDATNSFLSPDVLAGLPDAIVRQGCQLLDAQFSGQDRGVVKARLTAFVDRYLALRFAEPDEESDPVEDDTDLEIEMEMAKGK